MDQRRWRGLRLTPERRLMLVTGAPTELPSALDDRLTRLELALEQLTVRADNLIVLLREQPGEAPQSH